MGTSGISSGFPLLSQSPGQVPHVLLTRSPLHLPQSCDWLGAVRLACVKHAASVRPEPGSNSPSRSCPGCPGAIILKSRRPGFLIPRANWHEDGHWFVVRSSASCIDSARFDCSKCARTRFWLSSIPFSRCTRGGGTRLRRVVGAGRHLVRFDARLQVERGGHLGGDRPVCAVRRFPGGFSTYSRAGATVKMTGEPGCPGFHPAVTADGSVRGVSL